MPRTFRFPLVAAAALAATLACAGKPTVNFAYDHAASFQGLKTYAWFDDPNFQMPGGNSIVDGQFVDKRVRGQGFECFANLPYHPPPRATPEQTPQNAERTRR